MVQALFRQLRRDLRDYFQLDTPLEPLYERWSAADSRMARVATALPGMRVLRQDPVECLFSFICSSNNNIGRIGGMLQALRRQFGEPLPPPTHPLSASDVSCESGPAAVEPGRYFTFPTSASLAAASEEELRALGIGYRAGFIRATARTLSERGEAWLPALRELHDRQEVQSSLCELRGVGQKVADCVALFSLDQPSIVPVDTHVWEIACRDLDPELNQCASLTPNVYGRVGDLFRSRYGTHAGWAHSLLFAGELPQFKARLPAELQEEMLAFKALEKQNKAEREAKRKKVREGKAGSSTRAPATKPKPAKPTKPKPAKVRKLADRA